MKTVEIKGTKYPVEFSCGAAREFKKLTGREVDQAQGFSEMVELLYACVKSSCRARQIEFPLDVDEFCDHISLTELEILPQILAPGGTVPEPEAKAKKKTAKS